MTFCVKYGSMNFTIVDMHVVYYLQQYVHICRNGVTELETSPVCELGHLMCNKSSPRSPIQEKQCKKNSVNTTCSNFIFETVLLKLSQTCNVIHFFVEENHCRLCSDLFFTQSC